MPWLCPIIKLQIGLVGVVVVKDKLSEVYQEQQKQIKSLVIEMCANHRNLNFIEENNTEELYIIEKIPYII